MDGWMDDVLMSEVCHNIDREEDEQQEKNFTD